MGRRMGCHERRILAVVWCSPYDFFLTKVVCVSKANLVKGRTSDKSQAKNIFCFLQNVWVSPVRPSARPSVRPPALPSARLPVRPSVRPPVRPSVRPKRPKRSRLAPGFVGPQVPGSDSGGFLFSRDLPPGSESATRHERFSPRPALLPSGFLVFFLFFCKSELVELVKITSN